MAKKQSIIFKITTYLIIVLVVTYISFTTYGYFTIKNKAYAELENNSRQKLTRLQNGLITPMWNLNNKEGATLLSLEMDIKFVECIKVVQKDGRLFVCKSFNENDSICEDTVFNESQVYASYDILVIKGTDTLGTVNLYINDHSVEKRLKSEMMASAFTSLIQILVLTFALFYLIKKVMVAPLTQILDRLKDIAQGEGDLTKRLEIHSEDEIGMVALEFNTFVEKLQNIIISINTQVKIVLDTSEDLASASNTISAATQEVSSQTSTVASSAEEATSNVNNISNHAETMSSSVNMVATAIEEISASFNEVSKSCQEELKIATNAKDQAVHTQDIMGKLSNAAKEITKIVDVINDIADQTNLLALNATIEAASAGDAGKGFAVVANEVKELAKQSAQATKEIEGQVKEMFDMTSAAVKEIDSISIVIGEIDTISQSIASSVEEQSATANEVASNIGSANNSASEIANNVQDTATGLSEVTANIQGVNSAVNDTASNISNISDNAKDLMKSAADLHGIIRQFKV